MSFAAEPYGVFVDDLLTGLTGGVVREEFTFTEEQEPFRLGFGAGVVPTTVRIHGLVDGTFHRFVPATDFGVQPDGTIAWLSAAAGVPAAGAVWPDRGSRFYATYERTPDPQARPVLTDRNPGSVVRLLAESFAREYAVVSRQLEAVYRGAFLETAEGRDLDKVVALVGVQRRGRTVASGEVVFARTTAARADIFIPAGTLISTGEAPPVTVETADDRTLRAGTLSVATPVRATVEGPAGVAPAGTLTVIHRPILGIESVSNPQAMTFGGSAETDESLRRRSARALEAGGRSTVGALTGALTSVEGIREQDLRIVEDHLAFPGVVKISVASDLDPATAAHAAALLEEARPAGIRLLHNLPIPPAVSVPPAGDTQGQDPGPLAPSPPADAQATVWFPIGVTAVVAPSGADLTATQKAALTTAVKMSIGEFVDALGVGETVIYNRLVAAIIGVDGVQDVSLDLYPAATAKPAGRRNLPPSPPDTRPRLDVLDITLRGALVALDVTADVERRGLAQSGDPAAARANAREDIARLLADRLATHTGTIDQATLKGALPDTATYAVKELSYTAEFVDEGLRISIPNRAIEPTADQQPWLRDVTVREAVVTT
jgi:uncharacterized phage protein gp47/JayE